MHEEAYNWKASDKINPVLDDIVSIHLTDASLTGGKVTPRTFIRSFISVLDTVQQNQSFFKNSSAILEMFNEQEGSGDIDFDDIGSLRLEAKQKLKNYAPRSIGQASRISGVSPADISVLLVYMEQKRR